jgi:ribonuclease III
MSLEQIQTIIDFEFKDPSLLQQALCHKSYHKEHPEVPHNEKLEFLGDAILDAILSDLLMQHFADDSEGSLSRKRASIVNEDRLAELGLQLRLSTFLLVGEREANNRLDQNPRIIASILEAIIGAIYKDQGFAAAFHWVEKLFSPILAQAFAEHDYLSDYKTRFQEWVQEEYRTTPKYTLISQSGPDHSRTFEVEVFIGSESWGSASGSSKKNAAQNAARQALERVKK